jgi:glycyl-tRNA synthetase beta chain
MVEHPVAAAGGFDPAFLSLPQAVLSTAMIHHQRFIPVRAADGSPAPHYVAILNCRSDPATVARIRRGNEWVLRARLRDADFFWKEDLKRSLEDRRADLARVQFEATLGSYRLKVDRVENLAVALCQELSRGGRSLDCPAVERAARLCKADLTTLLVKEFPELQGIVGGLYAREEGEGEAVCQAISQQYLGAGESAVRQPFHTDEGAALAIADRLDTLAGFFLIGRIPTGSKDPYGLRRCALAVVHAALDRGIHLSIHRLLCLAAALYEQQGVRRQGDGMDRLAGFIEERVRHVCQEQLGLRYDAVNAALAVGSDDPLDAVRRAEALHRMRGESEFEGLILSYRRVRNILAGQDTAPFQGGALPSGEEVALLHSLQQAEDRTRPLVQSRSHLQALRVMASLRSPLDRFFEKVLVMDADPVVRGNRLGLLRRVSDLLLQVGDFAEMVLEGETAVMGAAGGGRG